MFLNVIEVLLNKVQLLLKQLDFICDEKYKQMR